MWNDSINDYRGVANVSGVRGAKSSHGADGNGAYGHWMHHGGDGMKRKDWTGPERRRLKEMCAMGYMIEQACEELGRPRGSVRAMCEKMGVSLKGMYQSVGLKKSWNEAYLHGKKAKTKAECPHARGDLYHFCAWQAGFNDRRMYG